ncbi:MAG: aldehyde dehydrogenase family protein, partial [Bacteroidaceae bacterium]|nr:aldehyde dehydrogenase family protein [Bacteroidaceae bacterium]
MMKLENTSMQEIKTIVEAQRAFFRSGETLGLKFRQQSLCALSQALKQWESRIAEALWQDLHKSYEEAYLTELSIVLGEIDNHLHHLKHWVMPKRVSTPLKMMPSRSK